MTTITRKFTFDAGHRVLGHESKCAHLHGHTYTAEVTVREMTDTLDTLGRVIDFSVIKTEIGGWIERNWDHNFLTHEKDPLHILLRLPLHHMTGGKVNWLDLLGGDGQKIPYIMKYGNPTAENIARELFEVSNSLLRRLRIECVNVRIWETPNCFADYNKDDPKEVSTLKPN